MLVIPLGNFARGAADQPPLAVAGQRVAVNICYEDAFGEAIAPPAPQATLLVNVSNVAWFGDSLAPRSTCRSRSCARSRPAACSSPRPTPA